MDQAKLAKKLRKLIVQLTGNKTLATAIAAALAPSAFRAAKKNPLAVAVAEAALIAVDQGLPAKAAKAAKRAGDKAVETAGTIKDSAAARIKSARGEA